MLLLIRRMLAAAATIHIVPFCPPIEIGATNHWRWTSLAAVADARYLPRPVMYDRAPAASEETLCALCCTRPARVTPPPWCHGWHHQVELFFLIFELAAFFLIFFLTLG